MSEDTGKMYHWQPAANVFLRMDASGRIVSDRAERAVGDDRGALFPHKRLPSPTAFGDCIRMSMKGGTRPKENARYGGHAVRTVPRYARRWPCELAARIGLNHWPRIQKLLLSL